ncbi:hypothetical protein [Paracoccus sp. SY]|uniref:hypothetical protein n=1 Tax=Paracoccus sp. SY TaxID=1330255 RepID=UPI000CD0661F|nr:hypothetical protein [Paracoccus sp. SY]
MPNVAGVFVSQDGTNWTYHAGNTVSGYAGGAALMARLAGPLENLTTLQFPPAAPAFTAGSIAMDGADLVITPHAVTGNPAPNVTFTLTRNGVSVLGEIVDGRIPDAAPGNYVATWVADNDVEPNDTRTIPLTIAAPDVMQIGLAPGVSLPTPGLFDGMSLDNIPGYAVLANPASYASSDAQGGVGTVTFRIDGNPITASTMLLTDGVLTVVAEGTNGEVPLVYTVGTVQWAWTAEVNEAEQTLAFSDNPAAPDALAITVDVEIAGVSYQFAQTLGEIRARPRFAQGFPRLVTPDKPVLQVGDTISVDIGPVIVVGGFSVNARQVRNGEIYSAVSGTSYQINENDYGASLGFNVLLTDARGAGAATAGATEVASVEELVPDATVPQFVRAGTGVTVGVGTLTVPMPEAEVGNLILLAIAQRAPDPAPTFSGFDPVGYYQSGTGTGQVGLGIYRRTAGASNPNVSFSSADCAAAQAFVFSNVGNVVAFTPETKGSSTSVTIAAGGTPAVGSLVLPILATRSGPLTAKPSGTANPGLPGLIEIGDVRTQEGADASITTFVDRYAEGSPALGSTTTTIGTLTKQWVGIHINLTAAA